MQTALIPAEFTEIAAICAAADVVIGNRTVLGIADARALHAGLKVGRDYSHWIKSRIEKFGFVAGLDYQVLSANLDSPDLANQVGGHGGDRKSLTYRLTLDMAKELAMVENNDVGRIVRRYYIWAESAARSGSPLSASQTGGITKAVVNKSLDERFAPMERQMILLAGQVSALLNGYDPTQAIVSDFQPMLTLLQDRGVKPKKRRQLSQRCSRLCTRWLIANGRGADIRLSRETHRYLFQVAAAQEWMNAEGNTIIAQHQASLIGQAVMNFARRPRLIPIETAP